MQCFGIAGAGWLCAVSFRELMGGTMMTQMWLKMAGQSRYNCWMCTFYKLNFIVEAVCNT